MLSTSFDAQHGARCWRSISHSGLVISSIGLQHRCCTLLQPCRPSEIVKVSATKDTSSAGASSSSSSSSSYPFYNRKRELEYLAKHCSIQPGSISVILGPRSTGKIALLKEYLRERGLANSRCFIDARAMAITTPSALARALAWSAFPEIAQRFYPQEKDIKHVFKLFLAALSTMQDKLKLGDGTEISFGGKALEPILKFLAGESGEALPLEVVTEGYCELLDIWDQARAVGNHEPPPVLVLDEANVLLTWDNQYKVERQALLRFFVAISKAQRRTHVLLATSDYSLQTWLNQEIGPNFDTFVIGDFAEEEAKGFLNQCLEQVGEAALSSEPAVPDGGIWTKVHQVCGGNAGALLRAAGFSRSLGGWEAALSQVAKDIWRSMKLGYRPAPDAGYTATDFATAVKAILESKYNAVNDDDLEAVVGQLPLEAMLRANLLALRPYSPWATDIHVEAFGPHQRYTLVTAPTSLHLYLMKAERSIILAALNTQQVPPEDSTNHSAGASRPASPESDAVRAVIDQLTVVQGKIDAVDKQIEEVHEKVTSIMQTEKKGWQSLPIGSGKSSSW